MPTFFFHTNDEVTSECIQEDVREAKCDAARYIGRLVCDHADKFWENGGDMFLAVSDERGLILFTLEVVGHDAPALMPPLSRSAIAE